MRSFALLPLISLLPTAYAWPWPVGSVQELEHLFRRQNAQETSQTAQPASTATNMNTLKTSGVQSTGTSATGSPTSSNSKGQTTQGASQITVTQGGRTTTIDLANLTSTEYDQRDAPGGISMISPNPASSTQYYKIGDWVHFAWNYTSLQATPTAINIVASCSANNFVYTLASNQTIQPTGQVYWDTGSYQQNAQVPLLTNQYTLIIWDASKAMSAVPSAGYLSSYNQFSFGMYAPQPYQNLSDFNCATCKTSSAVSLERMTLSFLLGTVAMTVFSFTWFVSGLAL